MINGVARLVFSSVAKDMDHTSHRADGKTLAIIKEK
jgi:hypothetical protein